MSGRLLILTGPTGVGKTEVALILARQLDTEIISADSMQVYRHLSIGTAKPTPEELGDVRYHLIDYIEPDHQYNLGDFLQDADPIIRRLHGERKLPIVCGGTGLYLRGLVQGVFSDAPRYPDIRDQLQKELEERGLAALYEEMRATDPAATHITPRDRQRILRALEVYRGSGKPITSLQTQDYSDPKFDAVTIVLTRPREELYERINRRVATMAAAGLLDEVRRYLACGYSDENPAIQALGYRELIQHLRGEIDLDTALSAMKQKSRNYAKRQMTWFRAIPNANVVEVSGKEPAAVVEEIKKTLALARAAS